MLLFTIKNLIIVICNIILTMDLNSIKDNQNQIFSVNSSSKSSFSSCENQQNKSIHNKNNRSIYKDQHSIIEEIYKNHSNMKHKSSSASDQSGSNDIYLKKRINQISNNIFKQSFRDATHSNATNGFQSQIFSQQSSEYKTNTHIGMRYFDPKTYVIYPLFYPYKNIPIDVLQSQKLKYLKITKILDTIISICDIIVIIFCFVYMFYLIHPNDPTAVERNGYLTGALCLNIIIIILLIARMVIHIKEIRIAYLLNILFGYQENLYYTLIVIEIIVHLLMPYNFLNKVHWNFLLGNIKSILHLNLLLFLLTYMRMYTLIRCLKKFSYFSRPRSKRLLSYFNVKNEYKFIFRSLIRSNNFLFLVFLLTLLVLITATIMLLFEKSVYQTSYLLVGDYNYYSNYLNCIATLALSTITIGFGNQLIKNPFSRVLNGMVSILGLFIITLIVLRIITWLRLDPEELKSYKIIELVHNKSSNGFIRNYISQYVKYKFFKIKNKKPLLQIAKTKADFQVYKNQNFVKVKDAITETFEVEDLGKEFYKKEEKLDTANFEFNNHIGIMEKQVEELLLINDKIHKQSKHIKTKFYKLINLGKLIASVDAFTHLENIDMIKGKKIIKSKDIKRSVREFQVKYQKRNPKGEEVIINNAIYEEDSQEEELSDLKSLNTTEEINEDIN